MTPDLPNPRTHADAPGPDASDPVIPAALAERLRAASRGPAPVGMDDAVLAMAARDFAARRRRRWTVGAAGLAAAAGLALAATLGPMLLRGRVAAPVGATALAEDLNGDGRVDIDDAFFLARALRDGVATRPAWDITGDGAVDGGDVDAIAQRAVRLASAGTGAGGGAS